MFVLYSLPPLQDLGLLPCKRCMRVLQPDSQGSWNCQHCSTIANNQPLLPPGPPSYFTLDRSPLAHAPSRHDSLASPILYDSTDTDADSVNSQSTSSLCSLRSRTPPSSSSSTPKTWARRLQRPSILTKPRRSDRPTDDWYCAACGSSSCNDRAHRKQIKEQRSRLALQGNTQGMEDMLICYVAPEAIGSAQTSGNKTSSGLLFVKADVYGGHSAVAARTLDSESKAAILAGTEDELQAKRQGYIQDYMERGDPTWGTLMYDPSPKCAHEKKLKRCTTHDHPNWAECRKQHRTQAFEYNKAEFKRAHGL